jgi:hypothetical protein
MNESGAVANEAQDREYDEALDPEVDEAFEVEIDLELEARDIHEVDEALGSDDGSGGDEYEGRPIKPRSIRAIAGMGKVYDYRGTGLCPPNGGRIRPLCMVHHIPVVANAKGTADLVRLADVLRAQGLAIQAATDAEGNVALYTRLDELCFGQRGANQFSCGVEHMHVTVGEAWSERQMRAAAWLANQAWISYGIPPHRATLLPGRGVARVARRGHTSHQNVSTKAGFNDRSDPGKGFDYPHLYELTRFYNKHKRF